MTLLQRLKNYGYFYESTNNELLEKILETKKIAFYVGFDCTADSLHVGNLTQIMLTRFLQNHGHRPIILLGGATSRIGDPTGKDKLRVSLTSAQIESNMDGIKKSLKKFIHFGNEDNGALLVNNADWFDEIKYLDFLDNFGRNFSVNRMLTMDSVRTRLEREQSLTFLEFNYMLIQSYDFYHLYKKYGCVLQLGGSDQWGNIVFGVDLIKKINNEEMNYNADEAFGLTTPLLTNASGEKMGKSVGGAVWLNEEKLGPYEYFQYWRNIDDVDVVRLAKLYGEFSDEEIVELEIISKTDINQSKKRLAYKVTEICHGTDNANQALETSKKIFEEKAMMANLPTKYINYEDLKNGVICAHLIKFLDIVPSNSEAKKLIRGHAVKINDILITNESLKIDSNYLIDDAIKISIGKKRHFLIKSKL